MFDVLMSKHVSSASLLGLLSNQSRFLSVQTVIVNSSSFSFAWSGKLKFSKLGFLNSLYFILTVFLNPLYVNP